MPAPSPRWAGRTPIIPAKAGTEFIRLERLQIAPFREKPGSTNWALTFVRVTVLFRRQAS